MEINGYDNGVPCWVDLGIADMDKATAFYGGLFGWEVNSNGPEAGGYATATLRGKSVAGLGPQMTPGPPYWATYIKTDSVEDTLAKAAENGGTILMPRMEVLDVGVMGIFADSQGAALSVWEPKAHKGSELANEPGSFSWNELSAVDPEAARSFYPGVFGWGVEVTTDGPMPYTEWHVDGRAIAGMMPQPPDVPEGTPPYWAVYFAVEDCDASVAKVVELGGQALMEPMDVPPGRFCFVQDDQGAAFGIIKLAES